MPELSDNFDIQWPVDSCWRISSTYGWRVHPVSGVKTFHGGVDIACPVGTAVKMPFAGIVHSMWMDEKHGGGRSMTVKGRVRFKDGTFHEVVVGFAHLLRYADATALKCGKERKAGTVIAFTGGEPGSDGAGLSTGAHLHMTLRVDNQKVDPLSENVSWNIGFGGEGK